MDATYETVWICKEAVSSGKLLSSTAMDPRRHPIHRSGCVRIVRQRDVVSINFDGRSFDAELCDRLIACLSAIDRDTARIDFHVWAGAMDGENTWIRRSAATIPEACRFVRSVMAVSTAADIHLTISTIPIRLEKLLLERREIFDEVVAAWLLDRTAGNSTLERLFQPARERPDEGLKVVRLFHDNLRFERYRAAHDHVWTADQRTRLLGSDLGAVLDRRLANSLKLAVQRTRNLGEPYLEQVTGMIQTDSGRKLGQYHRLCLPLQDVAHPDTTAVLVATRW